MRVAVIGKGGSGKTLLSTILVRAMRDKFKAILAVDADINAHLALHLGFPQSGGGIGDHFSVIAEYLINDPALGKYPLIGTMPPRRSSKLVRIDEEDELLQRFAQKEGNLYALSVGTYNLRDIGDACFHSKLNALEMLMHHLIDGRDELVVIDSAAGIDVVATSLYLVPDITFVVVEPTEKSARVYDDFLAALGDKIAKYQLRVIPVYNKVEGAADLEFLAKRIGNPAKAIVLNYHPVLADYERGDLAALVTFQRLHQSSFDRIEAILREPTRDKKLYYQALVDIFNDECRTWANQTFGDDFAKLIDQDFQYPIASDSHV